MHMLQTCSKSAIHVNRYTLNRVAARLVYHFFPLKWHGDFAATNTDTATKHETSTKTIFQTDTTRGKPT